MIYMDNAATTKISKKAVEAMEPYLNEVYGNPSSIYKIGKKAKNKIEEAREDLAKMINAKPEEIYFTSGGTESDNWVLNNSKHFGNHIITSSIEHHAILNKCGELETQGVKVSYVPVDSNGLVCLEKIAGEIREDTSLISIMFANNEIGTIEPIKKIGEIAREYNISFHSDGVQAFGHIPIDVKELNIDMLSVSGHKFHGPKGVGFLYVKNYSDISPYIIGGGQEKGKRAGTENVAGIMGMHAAALESMSNMEKNKEKEIKLRNYLMQRVINEIPNVRINGHITNRLPGNCNLGIKGVNGTSLVLLMDRDGICVSAASACSSGSNKGSHVFEALNIKDYISSEVVRITLCADNTLEDVKYVIHRLKENVRQLRETVEQ